MTARLRVVRHGEEVLGYIGRDEHFPRKLAQVLGPPEDRESGGERWRVRPRLYGTPFAAPYAGHLRTWAAAFVQMADELERFGGKQ